MLWGTCPNTTVLFGNESFFFFFHFNTPNIPNSLIRFFFFHFDTHIIHNSLIGWFFFFFSSTCCIGDNSCSSSKHSTEFNNSMGKRSTKFSFFFSSSSTSCIVDNNRSILFFATLIDGRSMKCCFFFFHFGTLIVGHSSTRFVSRNSKRGNISIVGRNSTRFFFFFVGCSSNRFFFGSMWFNIRLSNLCFFLCLYL